MSFDVPSDILQVPITGIELRQVPKPVIVNCVVTFDFAHGSIDIEPLTLRLPGFGYNPQKFAAVKMRLSRAMSLGFIGGRSVCPGARSIHSARTAVMQFVKLHIDAGVLVNYRRFKVQNIVCSVWAPFEVDIKAIQIEYSARSEYKSDKFPGCSFRMTKPKVVFNIFVTGRVVITGSRDYDHSIRCWWWLYTHVLVRHKRGSTARTTNSAAYKREILRNSDTMNVYCSQLSSQRTRRKDGPLASSSYASRVGTPRATPMLVPVTPRYDSGRSTPVMNSEQTHDVQDAAVNIATFFERMQYAFLGHQIGCPFVSYSKAMPEYYWRSEREKFELVLAGAVESGLTAAMLLEPHVAAGCCHSTVISSGDCAYKLNEYITQLTVAEGESTTAPTTVQETVKGVENLFSRMLSLEEARDWEAAYRLDATRERLNRVDHLKPEFVW